MESHLGTREFWRLGHRRPWWQWNVVTLLAALFALTWARELLRLSQTATWIICAAVVAGWLLAPALVESVAAAEPGRVRVTRVLLVAWALAIIAGVMALFGFFAGVMSVAAALLAAAAVRSQHD